MAAFNDIYHAQDRYKWKRAGELFNLRQTVTQPVPIIITKVEMLAKKAGLDDAQTVLNGLTPTLRQAVLTKKANTMENVRKWTTIAEGAIEPYSTDRYYCDNDPHPAEACAYVSSRGMPIPAHNEKLISVRKQVI